MLQDRGPDDAAPAAMATFFCAGSCVPPCDDDREIELATAAFGARHSLGDPAVDLAEQLLDEAILRHARSTAPCA